MKKIIVAVLFFAAAVILVSDASAQTMTAANTWLTNIVFATANNVTTRVSNEVATKVVTNYGGAFTAVSMATCQKGALGGTNWFFSFTNKGNATSQWIFKFQYTNVTGSANFIYGIGTTPHQVAKTLGPQTLTVGQVFGLYVFISNTVIPTDGSVLSVRLVASNNRFPAVPITSTRWTNYTGDNGILYGGDIGESYAESGATPLQDTFAGRVFMQDLGSPLNGQLSLKIATPILRIAKRLTSTTIGGVAQTYVIPGTKLTYLISITNVGTGTALNMRIRDLMPTALSNFTVMAVTNVGFDDVLSTADTGGNLAVWTNNSFAGNNTRAGISFSVIVK